MKKIFKLMLSIAAPAVYLLVLRYIAPGDEPYFILGIAVVGLVAWLLGKAPGLLAILLLIPLTDYVYSQFDVSTSYRSFARSPAYLGMQCLTALALGYLRHERTKRREYEEELNETNHHLQHILLEVKELGGVHNVCGYCKKIQDDSGNWQEIDHWLKEQTKMEISHCICADCAKNFQPQAEESPTDPPDDSKTID